LQPNTFTFALPVSFTVRLIRRSLQSKAGKDAPVKNLQVAEAPQ